MTAPYPDDATIELILAATLAAIHSGKIPLPENNPQIADLRLKLATITAAALAVVQRWETPLWKDAEPTAAVIARLRDAVGP